MYLKPTSKHIVIDIETDGLSPTVIWCMCAVNVLTGQEWTFTDYESMRSFIEQKQKEGCKFIGHNIIGYDALHLNRLVGTRITVSSLVDSFLLSSLYSPSLVGGHSLDAWGTRLKFPKTKFNDWSKLSDDMVTYCLNDCRVNVRVYLSLASRMASVGFSERCCEIEHKAWANIKKQQRAGFQLDVPRAHELYSELRQLERELKEQIYKQWPPELLEVKHFKNAYKQDGSHTAGYQRHREQYPEVRIDSDGSYRAFDYVEFNLGSPKQRVEKLLELGWKPREFTKPKSGAVGSPQATRKGQLTPSLEEFLETVNVPEVKLLAEWIAINARGNMVSNWIDLADSEGLIHGNLWLAGTLRYRHDKPNTANIPAVRVDDDEKPLLGRAGQFTYESRDLWTVRDRESRSLVGVDAKGIQLRVLAHYLNNDSFTAAILSSDPHSANQKAMELPTRAVSKTILYAILMGAGDAKIAGEAKVSLKDAKRYKEMFFSRVPELRRLISRLQNELKRTGRITLCDGAKVLVPSDHMVIPYLLQGDESRIMKQAGIYVDEFVRKEKLDAIKVGDIHDEWQTDCYNDHVEAFTRGCRISFQRSGESFNYNLPIECSSKVGSSWAKTH